MHLARFAGLEHEADARARAFANEVVMNARDCEERGDGRVVFVHATVGEDDDVRAVLDGLGRGFAQVVHRLLQAAGAFAGLEERG